MDTLRGKQAGDPITVNVAIVGAGPVGLFAVFECGMLGFSSVLVDALDTPGGQCTALYPEKPIYDIPGHPAIEAGELVSRLEAQIAPFAAQRLFGRRVESCTGRLGGFCLRTDRGERIKAQAIIIAAGAGAFGPNRPPLAGLGDYEASGAVQYYIRRRELLRGKKVVIAGGGDSAIDWALALRGVAEKIMIVHRRPKFRAAPDSISRLQNAAKLGDLDLITPFQLHALHGSAGVLEAVEVASLDGETKRLPADVLLPFFGLSAELGPIASWGLDLYRHQIKVTPETCVTTVPGIFAIGDVAHYPGKLKLILQGFSEAAMAAHAIFPIIHPDQELHFEYSTTKGLPAGLAANNRQHTTC